jgi:hypothetical protein
MDMGMKQLTKSEKEKIFSRTFWDMNIDIDALLGKFNASSDGAMDTETIIFCRRLLTSCDWYTLLKLMTRDNIRKMLTSTVTDGIYPKDLKVKFQYAKSVLSR